MELSSVKNSNLKLRIGFLTQCYKNLQLFSLQSAKFFRLKYFQNFVAITILFSLSPE